MTFRLTAHFIRRGNTCNKTERLSRLQLRILILRTPDLWDTAPPNLTARRPHVLLGVKGHDRAGE